jgi:hypothetical protein
MVASDPEPDSQGKDEVKDYDNEIRITQIR